MKGIYMIIRFSDEEVFGVDSQEYEVLANAVKEIKGVEGALVEIGTRRGGSAKLIIDTLVNNGDNNRSMFCIDPYGNIEIPCTNLNMTVHNPDRKIEGDKESKELTSPQRFDYDNTMRNRTIPSLYFYAYNAGLNFTFFCLEDNEFIKRYADGVPVYEEYKKIEDKYAFVFFDGPHDNENVKMEVDFFVERASVGATFVFDDIWMYDHDMIENILFSNGFEALEKKNIKASYKKTK
jgi:cephalosporin hydroxylase